MVRIAIIELPIQFIRNLPRIKIQFDDGEDTSSHYGKLVDIVLRNTIPSSLDTWSYTHVLQETNIIHLTGVAYGNYVLEIKPHNSDETIELSYQVYSLSNEWTRETITSTQSSNIDISVFDDSQPHTRFNGALMTSGSFTMMASGSL